MASISLNSNLVKTVMLKVIGDGGDANRTLDEIAAKAKALEDEHPELTVSINRAKAMADATVMKAELRRVLEDPIKVPVEPKLSNLFTREGFTALLTRLFGGAGFGGGSGGFGGGIPGIGGALKNLTGPGGLGGLGGSLALVASLGAALNFAGGALANLLAGGLGVGSLGALAYPTVSGILSSNSAYATAIGNYQTASANLNTAIHQSPADLKAYQATLQNIEPDLRNAAALLTNQNIAWQNLSPAMQRSVTALANNKEELKLLLPDQKKALEALTKQRDAWNSLDPAQQKAVNSLQKIAGQWDQMVADLEPAVMQIVNDFLPIVQTLMPYVERFAKAAAPAIDTLVKQFGKFVLSKDFKDFMDYLIKLTPGAIIGIGRAIGQLAGAIGNLVHSGSAKVALELITGALKGLAGAIDFAATHIKEWNKNVDQAIHEVRSHVDAFVGYWERNWARMTHDVSNWYNDVVGFVKRMVHDVVQWFDSLPGELQKVGRDAISGFINGLKQVPVIGS